MEKNQIRQWLKTKRLEQSSQMVDEASLIISKKLMIEDAFKNSSIIFLYAAKKEEVQTKSIFEIAKQMNKQVAFPKVCSHTQTMKFYLVERYEDLELNQYGRIKLLEPHPNSHQEVIPSRESVMIVPAIGFDQYKNRIGYGGGFYDKYLAKYHIYTIGICFDFQIVEKIPSESLDQPMHIVISEKRIVN